jgi:hypothetical protein
VTAPDPKTVREIAREIILDCGRNADDIGTYVWVRVGADLSKHEHGAWCSAIREAIRTAQITASWPTEQQPAAAAGGEQVQDGAAADADPYDWDPVYAAATIAELQKQLAAEAERAESATVLPERWRALTAERDTANERAEKAKAERDEARELARASLDILRNVSDEPMRELFEVDDMDELPGWFTGYGKPSDTLAPDASPDGRSATETDAEPFKASGVELEFGKGTAGPSEPEDGRDTSAWCWAPNPNGPLHCGLLRDHEPPHRRGERTWIDNDTTEDGR